MHCSKHCKTIITDCEFHLRAVTITELSITNFIIRHLENKAPSNYGDGQNEV